MSEIPAFILEGRCRYRNGDAPRILATDCPGEFPIVSMTPLGHLMRHSSNGRYYQGEVESDHDLVEIPAEPAKPREWWILPEAGPKDRPRLFTSLPEGVDPEGYIRVVEVLPGYRLTDEPEIEYIYYRVPGFDQNVIWRHPKGKDAPLEYRRPGNKEWEQTTQVLNWLLSDGVKQCDAAGNFPREPKPLPPGIPQPPEDSLFLVGLTESEHRYLKRLMTTLPEASDRRAISIIKKLSP